MKTIHQQLIDLNNQGKKIKARKLADKYLTKSQGMIVTENTEDQDWETEYDDDGCGMSHRDQCNADRSDYINERLENGEIDDIQAAELRMGA